MTRRQFLLYAPAPFLLTRDSYDLIISFIIYKDRCTLSYQKPENDAPYIFATYAWIDMPDLGEIETWVVYYVEHHKKLYRLIKTKAIDENHKQYYFKKK